MSRSNPTPTNPAQHFFEWKGGEGKLEFYDKEKQQRVGVPLPFEFLPLDQLSTITGYSKQDKRSFYSNEVRNSAKDEFNVKIGGMTRYVGLYKNEQGIPQIPKGATFAKSIYIAHKTRGGEYIIGNIKASGSALGAWIEFSQKCVPENGKVIMRRGKAQDSQVGEFYAPEFEFVSTNAEEDSIAITLDKQLQIYLNQYLAISKHDNDLPSEDGFDEELGKATPEQVEDFENRKRKNRDHNDEAIDTYQKEAVKEDVVITDFGDEPINLDNIPF